MSTTQEKKKRTNGKKRTRPTDVRRKERRSPPQAAADQLLKATGGHGTNTLSLASAEKQASPQAPPNLDKQLDSLPLTSTASIASFALGIVLRAKKAGWNTSNESGKAFYAFRYIMDVVTSAFNGSEIKLQSAPRWFWEILVAFRPKNRQFKTGSIQYTTQIAPTDPQVNSGFISWGTTFMQLTTVLGYVGEGSINSFPILTAFSDYDPLTNGPAAFADIWSVFPSVPGTPSEMISLIGDSAFLRSDCSAFSAVTPDFGQTYFTPSGITETVQNEVFIDSPILAKFCFDGEGEDIVGTRRAYHQLKRQGGSPCYIGPRCLEFSDIRQFHNKKAPNFKCYNFDEYCEILSLILCLVQENSSRQQATGFVPYPLTALETRILLRQALIPFFSNEMAQDLRITGSEGNYQSMLPLTVSDNGVSQTELSGGMLVPSFFAEMAKGARRMTRHVEGRFKDSKEVIDYVPVLMRSPILDEPGQYLWLDAEEVPTPLYVIKPAEEYINIIDCSAQVDNVTVYVDLNGKTLSALIDTHNEWMKKNGQFMTALVPLSASLPATPFQLNVSTAIQLYDLAPTVDAPAVGNTAVKSPPSKQPSRKIIFKGTTYPTRRIGAGPDPVDPGSSYQSSVFSVVDNMSIPFPVEVQKWVSLMVCPVIFCFNLNSQDPSDFFQSIYSEAFSVPYGTGFNASNTNISKTQPTLTSKHLKAALLDVKQVLGTESEIEVVLNALTQNGKGGWLNTIADILSGGAAAANWLSSIF